MSIASEISRISNNVQNTIDAIEAAGVDVPNGANSDNHPSLAQALANTKQDKLTGAEGQVVGFDADGNAVAQEAPDGLPEGGTEGQVLTKTASGAEWGDVPSDLPEGGTNGQILTKTSDGVAWEDAPKGGVTSFNSRTGAITPQAGDYTAEMVGARANTWMPSAADVGAVPTTRTVNGKALSGNISLTAGDVGAVPTSRTVNNKPLSSNVTLTAADVGAGTPATLRTATLTTSGWSSNSQTLTVQGVISDSDSQIVRISPADKASATAWAEAGVWCTTQGTNSLTFTCDSVPSANINLNIELQEVG